LETLVVLRPPLFCVQLVAHVSFPFVRTTFLFANEKPESQAQTDKMKILQKATKKSGI